MDSRGFIQWMIISKKSQATINRNIEYVNFFQNYLSTKKKKDIDNANLKDLEDYKDWGESIKLKRLRMFIYSLATYYKFMKKKKMNLKANELVGSIELDEYRLSSFQGINKKVVKILKKNGINTAKQLLDIGYTKKGRKKLCESTGIEMKYINELIKLSDLARITGVKKIRARLYYTSGLDTLEKIAACDAEKLRRISSEFIRESGFDGTPPTPK